MTDHPLIEITRGRVVLGGVTILRDLELEIPVGQSTAILGPNGAGKTTLLRLLCREVYCQRDPGARVRILGRERWNVFDLRAQLGLVTHSLQMRIAHRPWDKLRGIDVALSGYFASVGVPPHQQIDETQAARADEVVDNLGVAGVRHRLFATLSSGEQRRFLLARALVNDPHTLILDEPTTSLDLRACFELLRLLRRLAREGKTLIVVTHHLQEVLPEIERVVLIRKGQIVFDGAKAEALTSERLSQLFEVAIKVEQSGGFYQAVPAP